VRLPSVSEEWQYTGNKLHPSQKPLMAIVPLILAFSQQDDIVLDPFAGSATTAVAARLCNRRYVMIEADPTYYRIAMARLNGRHAGATR
jgi:site-specific DNA-methyltransferase (adenine-specific)